ncbi:hypothetical protein BJX70DRAFT_388490 [Aspergillus crustosus]
MPLSQACDRSHSLKSRCLPGPAGNCYRCYRLHHPCTFSRRRGKRGPKPRILAESTWNFVSGDVSPSDLYGIVRARIAEAPALLLGPYGAVSRVFLRCKTKQTPCSDKEWSSCASALEALRTASITTSEDIGRFLSLPLGLVTFHRLISGISASTMCRFTLSLIRPYYYSGQLSEADTMELTCLIFLDTKQSLFRARVPVIEYRVTDPFRVDQHAGLCGPLLPLLYRICVLSAAVKARGAERELDQWSPNISASTLERYSEAEPEEISRSILNDLQHCLDVAGQFPPHITLVFLIAGAESHDISGREHVLSLVSRIFGAEFYPFIANLWLFLRRVWSARDRGKTRYLFELFGEDLELSMAV